MPKTRRKIAMLANVSFYKVGHHGSLNATPRKLLWEAFKKRKGRQLRTMMSTMASTVRRQAEPKFLAGR